MAFYITQLIYIRPGAEQDFEEFETLAIPLITDYNGCLLLRLRPGEDTVVEANTEKPYEVHLVRFDTEADFRRFSADPRRQKFLHLKEAALHSSLLIGGYPI